MNPDELKSHVLDLINRGELIAIDHDYEDGHVTIELFVQPATRRPPSIFDRPFHVPDSDPATIKVTLVDNEAFKSAPANGECPDCWGTGFHKGFGAPCQRKDCKGGRLAPATGGPVDATDVVIPPLADGTVCFAPGTARIFEI
jgi:hypothetical protein